MKHCKSQRGSVPPSGRSVKGPDRKMATPPTVTEPPPSPEVMSRDEPSRVSDPVDHGAKTDMDELRRKMAEAMARKEPSQPSASTSLTVSLSRSGDLAQHRSHTGETAPRNEIPLTAASSTDSAQTIKGITDPTPVTVRTPSYPFPRMSLRLTRRTSHMSAPSHKPFTLLSPTSGPQAADTAPTADEPASSETSTPAAQQAGEGPNPPTPDLYDMILMLSADPGLDGWWANVTQILAEAYGAERASLAVPGDTTDLENVPWAQKATFHVYGTDSALGSPVRDLKSTAEGGGAPSSPTEEVQNVAELPGPKRPPLESRHSIVGVPSEVATFKGTRQRPQGPVRATSSISVRNVETHTRPTSPKLPRQTPKPRPSFGPESPPPDGTYVRPWSESGTSVLHAGVHRNLQALEVESDPLMVRTGISALFGKKKPVILTRTYSPRVLANTSSSTKSPKVKGAEAASHDKCSPEDARPSRAYDEHEQPEPSPSSQNPAPSPAARHDPAEPPSFANAARVEEAALEQNPPVYDYSPTAKTVVHVPFVRLVSSRGILSSGLRFPIAILSFLSPINPYPKNLRHSLTHLLAHLASSYSLAQQYSAMADRVRSPTLARPSAHLGIGGTFSDENSELELVAELSGQVARGRDSCSSLYGNLNSPGERYRDTSSLSVSNTPFLEQIVLPPEPITPGKSGVGAVDSYFAIKRQRNASSPQVTPPGGREISEDPSDVTKNSKPKSALGGRTPSKKGMTLQRKSNSPPTPSASTKPDGFGAQEGHETSATHSTERYDTGVARHSSAYDPLSQKEAIERPLPELISTLMLNSVPLQLFLAKPKSGELVWTNSKFDAFRTQGEGRVKGPWQNVHKSDLDSLSTGWAHTLKTGVQFTQHVRVKRFSADDDYRWFIFRASPLLSHHGQLLYWIGSFLDVHDKYTAELKAAEEKEMFVRDAKYRALANSIPQILFEAIENQGIVSVNEQWHTFSGQSLDEALSLGFAKHVHRDDLQRCGLLSPEASGKAVQPPAHNGVQPGVIGHGPSATTLQALIEDGVMKVEQDENGRVSYTTELQLRSKGGEFRWFLVRLVKAESDILNKGRASWYGTCTDINDRKALERELNRVNKKMQEEMESKTRFFANMSHEIRTPLNGILGNIPWLVELPLDHDQRRILDTIANSSNNLRELVDNILDVTKVEAGKMSLVHRRFHVRNLLEEIIDTVASRAVDKGLELNYTIDLEVPAYVVGDEFRLRQVLVNLIGNAVKFTDQGEVYARCSLKLDPALAGPDPNTMYLAFDVVDTGRGFDKENFRDLFTQFGQVKGTNVHDAGSGLGLFLSKQLVEMHGGRLLADAKIGQGAVFSFYVQVEVPPPGEVPSSPPPRGSLRRAGTSDGGGPRLSSDSTAATAATGKGMASPPAPSEHVTSREVKSPAIGSPGSSRPSLRSMSLHPSDQSSVTSLFPTPESVSPATGGAPVLGRRAGSDRAARRSHSDEQTMRADQRHPAIYSVAVICPAEHARAAIKQHIEQVIPGQVVGNVTTFPDMGTFRELFLGPARPNFTHIVLDLPAAADVMLFMRQLATLDAVVVPTLVVITDHYQKRDIQDDHAALTESGRKAFMVHRPVKPSVFGIIFDPAQRGHVSKDGSRDIAQSAKETFQQMSDFVKQRVGNRGLRVLVVEDSDVNRTVLLRYLNKVALATDSAKNGREGTDMVLSKAHGHYALIICDIQMPVQNGYEVCEDIRQWEARDGVGPMPIMALTANAMPEERAAAGEAGFTNYLTKPVDFNTLGAMLVALLDATKPHVFLRDRAAA